MKKQLWIPVIVVVLVVFAILGLLYLRGDETAPSLLLISVDTLRYDRLGYAGHNRPLSPVIDRLAADGVVFTNCYSVAGWTLPAMATILSGQYPRDHGATDFHWSMSPDAITLASVLRRLGYDTRGYVSHVILKPRYGLAEGFAHYDFSILNVGHPHEIDSGRPLTDLVINDLDRIEKPYFLWVHYFDPHFEYITHPEWASFGDSDIDRYDQEIAHTDRQIGRLLGALDAKGLLDNAVVIFTSDHGEEFEEHGAKYHYTMYEEVMRVPLVIKAPGLVPRIDDRMASQIDLVPTILPLLGVDRLAFRRLPGLDLLSPPNSGGEDRALFMERDRPPPYNQRGVIHGGYKLTVIEYADTSKIPVTSRGTHVEITNVHPGIYLYDLDGDPDEQHNLYDERNPKARELLGLLSDHFSGANPPTREVDIDENLRKKLRSLGYIR